VTDPVEQRDPRPEPPVRPEPDDCCNGGCERCVFDLYEDALERYREKLAAWEARHANPLIDRGA
jgi:hypothetical protein